MSRFGRGPNGRALKADGTERKARVTLTPEEKIAQIAELEKKAYAGIGRKILASAEGFDGFISGLGTFKRWVKECKSFSDEDKRAARRAYYQAQIDAIDAKGEIAEDWLPGAEEAMEVISSLYSSLGEGYQALVKDGQANPENIAAMIAANLGDPVKEIVESANDPDNDPYQDYRRGAADNEEGAEDNDSL
jgi:hypothetical protein